MRDERAWRGRVKCQRLSVRAKDTCRDRSCTEPDSVIDAMDWQAQKLRSVIHARVIVARRAGRALYRCDDRCRCGCRATPWCVYEQRRCQVGQQRDQDSAGDGGGGDAHDETTFSGRLPKRRASIAGRLRTIRRVGATGPAHPQTRASMRCPKASAECPHRAPIRSTPAAFLPNEVMFSCPTKGQSLPQTSSLGPRIDQQGVSGFLGQLHPTC